ncbi:MAG: hypothetical protein Q4D40_03885 [Eubacteriales bacterium]|nr:hypothetical protein [Eubacteriales bacterium]
MKKSRILSGLLVLTMLSTCIISGTFAKYTTTETGSDSARVAKWGVNITANGTMFADNYATNDAGVVGAIAQSVITSGGTGDALVAPGTSGDLVESTITGTPEVAVEVKRVAVLTLNDKWVDGDGKFYCPIKITVNNGTESIDYNGTAYSSANEFKSAVENAINADIKKYGPNTDLSSSSKLDVKWSWPYSVSGENDVKDTYLGNKAANNGEAATIALSVTTTVTQID